MYIVNHLQKNQNQMEFHRCGYVRQIYTRFLLVL